MIQDPRKNHISANGEITFALSRGLDLDMDRPSQRQTSKPVFPFRTSRPLWCCPVSAALDVKLSTNMVGGKQIILIFFFLQPLLSQEECDPVFGDCGDPEDTEECDDVFKECGPTEPPDDEPFCDAVFDDCGGGECLSVNEIDDTVFNR